MRKNMKKCNVCMTRIKDLSIEQDQMARFCKSCMMLESRRAEGTDLLPVYTMDQLSEHIKNGLPLLTRNGLCRLT